MFQTSAFRIPLSVDDADTFQFNRANIRRHVAFGSGRHACIGMHLARAEVRATADLLQRTKRFSLLDPANPPAQLPLPFNRGIADLKVRLEPA